MLGVCIATRQHARMQIVPNLIVFSIEDCLPFYLRLGFKESVRVPHPPDAGEGAPIGFVILHAEGCELMLQSTASLALDVAALQSNAFCAVLYLRVPSLESLRAALAESLVMPERTTFYGARELIAKDPAGNTLFFAEHVQP